MDGWIPEAEGKGTHGYMMALTDFGVKLLFCYHVREGYHIRLPTHVMALAGSPTSSPLAPQCSAECQEATSTSFPSSQG
jgi:hypothetical protein